MTAKRTEKRETAKEAYRKQAAKESAKDASKDNSKDLESIKTLPSDALEIVKDSGKEMDKEAKSDKEISIITTTTISVATASTYARDKVVANLAPPHLANNEKKMFDKSAVRSEVTPAAT